MAVPCPGSDDFEIIDRQEASLGPKELDDIRKWLQPTDYDADSSEFHRHLSSQAPGTGLWICGTPRFQQWHGSDEHSSLWVKGVPGAGKSVTAASLIQHLKKENVPILFFFFRYIVVANRRSRSLARDWLAQLLPYSTQLQATLQPLLETALDGISDEELWAYLLGGLSSVEKAYCVVDAMDEMEQVPNDSFLQRLNTLSTFRPGAVKLLMTSRPKQYLQSALRDASIVHISLEQDLVGKDIAAFVSHRLRNAFGERQYELRSSLESTICTRSQGLFLYARLLLDQIILTLKSTENLDVETLANTLPIGLEDMYNSMLFQQAQTLKIKTSIQVFLLECATHASRPLRLNQLANFLGFVFSSELPSSPKEIARSACTPLLEIAEDETVQVIHHSFTEFLLDEGRVRDSKRGLNLQFPVLIPERVHRMMTIRCLDYLRSGVLGPNEMTAEEKALTENACKCDDDSNCECDRSGPAVFNYQEARLQHPFLEYAVTTWGHHATRCNADDQAFFQSINTFVDPESAAFRRWIALEWTTRKRWTEVPSALHIAAFAGLTEYTKSILLAGKSVDSLDAASRTPLHWACRRGHVEVVSLLLHQGAKSNEDDFQGIKPLHEAAKRDHARIVKMLLDAGVDPLTPKTCENHGGRLLGGEASTRGETAVEYAYKQGHTETILVMLPFLKRETVEELLCECCLRGKHEAVQAILDNSNVSVNCKSHGGSPLYVACRAHSVKCVEMLLAKGADINELSDWSPRNRLRRRKKDRPNPKTPLLGLASSGWTDETHPACHQIFRMLMSAGADLEAKDVDGLTALLLLSEERITLSRKAITSLIESKADTKIVDSRGNNILHRTLKNSRDILLSELLFENGCSVEDRGANGATILHTALSSSIITQESNSLDEFIAYLLRKGARCDLKNDHGWTALALAISNCSLDIFRRLLQSCHDIRARTQCIWRLERHSQEETVKFIRELISAGVSLETRDRSGRTPLLAHVRSEVVFDSLLECGADLHATDSRGQGVLHQFVYTPGSYNSAERLRKLVGYGLDPLRSDNNGNNLLHIAAPPYRGISQDVTFVQQIIDFGISVNAKNNLGQTPLHIHIEHGRVGSSDNQKTRVRLLDLFSRQTQGEKVDVNAQDAEGLTPLALAALRSEVEVAYLLDAKANPTILANNGRSILHIACRARKSNIVGYLLSKPACRAMIDSADSFGRTPLHDACTSGRPESVYYLLKYGANVSSKDSSGSTPLHACASFPEEERIWSSLRDRNEAAKQDVRTDRYRPFSFSQGWPEPWYVSNYDYAPRYETARISGIVNALISAGADVTAIDSDRFTPLDRALSSGCNEMVQILQFTINAVQMHWDVGNNDTKIKTEMALRQRPTTSLSSIPEELQKEILEHPIRYMSLLSLDDISWIVENGGDITGVGNNFEEIPLLHYVAELGLTEVMEKLGEQAKFYDNVEALKDILKNSKNPYFYKENFQPVLQVACGRQLSNLEMLELLVDKCGVDVNARGLVLASISAPYEWIEGSTALHCLAEGRYSWQIDALRMLVEKGAKIDAKNEDGETPLAIASVGNTKDHMGNDQAFWKAACVEALLDLGADPNILDEKGKSCLQKASSSPEIMSILLKRGGDLAAGQTSVMFSAIQSLNDQALRVILDIGVSPNSVDSAESCQVHYEVKDQERSALFCASFPYPFNNDINNSVPLIKLLIERGSNLYAPLNDRETLIHYVFEHSEYEIVCGFLACADKIDFDRRDQLGRTVFLAACNFTNALPGFRHKHWYPKETGPAIKILDYNANFTAIDNGGRNALHHLLDNADAEQDDILIFLKHEASKNLFKQKDGRGFTALNCALRILRPAVCEALIEMGANLLEPDPTGSTALHHIARQWLEVYEPIRRRRNNQDHPPQYYDGCVRLWQKFLDLGGDINVRDNKGSPPLFSFLASASRNDYRDQDPNNYCHLGSIDKFFATADLNARNNDGECALHIIARRGANLYSKPMHDSKLFEFMAGKGLDPLLEDNRGRSSLDVAAACENKGILDLFQYRY